MAQETAVTEEETVAETPNRDHLREMESVYTFNIENSDIPSASNMPAWGIVRMLLVLALAALAVYGVVYFLKKKTKGDTLSSDPFLRVLANAHLGNNRYAHIVSVGNKAWLLGSSDGGVNLIGEIDDKSVLDAMLLEDSKKAAEDASKRMPDFVSLLRKIGAPAKKQAQGMDEIAKRRERLRGL